MAALEDTTTKAAAEEKEKEYVVKFVREKVYKIKLLALSAEDAKQKVYSNPGEFDNLTDINQLDSEEEGEVCGKTTSSVTTHGLLRETMRSDQSCLWARLPRSRPRRRRAAKITGVPTGGGLFI